MFLSSEIAWRPSSRRIASKADLVFDDLRAAIVSLQFKPGTRIDKQEVCDRLGVSRQPVAEAISRLAREGLLEVEPQKGTFVTRIGLAELIEAAFIRRALEIATISAVASSIEDETIAELERSLMYHATALEARDWDACYALDLQFHAILFQSLRMPRVASVVETSRLPFERARRLLIPSMARSGTTLRDHRRIFAALSERNAAAAVDAMAAHLDATLAEIKQVAIKRPDLFET